MRRQLFVIVVLAVALAFASLALSNTAYADPPPRPAKQAAPPNTATVDITINDQGEVSVGGIPLSSLGLGRLDASVGQVVKNLENARLLVQGNEVTLDVQGTELMKILWDPNSRQALANLAAKYQVPVSPDQVQRIEDWVSTSTIDVTARYANEPSKPFNINLADYLQLDVAPDGRLTIEKIPLAYGIEPSTLQMIQRGGNQAAVCWDKGTLIAAVDGQELPTITIQPDGIDVIQKALNLPITPNIESVLGSRLGVDVSFAGGSHSGGTCGS
jgi:biopolymer transport protein ExbD